MGVIKAKYSYGSGSLMVLSWVFEYCRPIVNPAKSLHIGIREHGSVSKARLAESVIVWYLHLYIYFNSHILLKFNESGFMMIPLKNVKDKKLRIII